MHNTDHREDEQVTPDSLQAGPTRGTPALPDAHVFGQDSFDEIPSWISSFPIEWGKLHLSKQMEIILGGLTLVVVIAYTLITYVQWRTMAESTRAEHRPWVYISEFDCPVYCGPAGPEKTVPKGYLDIDTRYLGARVRNAGKTAAEDVVIRYKVFVTTDDRNRLPSIDRLMDEKGKRLVADEVQRPTLLAPDQDPRTIFVVFNRTTLPYFATSPSAALYIQGSITYVDIWAERHSTEFCVRLIDHVQQYCEEPKSNEVQ